MMGRRPILQKSPSWRTKHQGSRYKAKRSSDAEHDLGLGVGSKNESVSVFDPPGKMSDTLLQASVQVINRTWCNAEDAYQGEVTEKMLCAGVPGGGVDTCQVGPPRSCGVLWVGVCILERDDPPRLKASQGPSYVVGTSA